MGMQISRNDIKGSDLVNVSAVIGLLICYRKALLLKADEIFLSLFGKNLSGRNPVLQILITGFAALVCCLIPVLFRQLSGRKPKCRHASYVITLAILAAPMLQLLTICANQVLRRDDYWEIADALTYGFPGSMFVEMSRYNGRYTGWGLRSLHAVLPHIPYIDIFLAVDLILLTAGTSMLAYRLLKDHLPAPSGKFELRTWSLLSGFGIAIAFVLMSSNIWEFWFWGSGTMIYGLGVSLCVLSTALILNVSDDEPLRIKRMILPGITVFLTCGCSELCTASLAAFLLVILIWKRIRTKRWNRQALLYLAEVVVLTAGVFLLSGSLSYAGEYAHLQEGSANSLQQLLERLPVIINWAVSGLYGYTFIKYRELLWLLAIAFLAGTQLRFSGKTCRDLLITAVLLTVTAHCVLMINSAVDYMPPRVITVGICWFFTGMALVCLTAGSLLNKNGRLGKNPVTLILCAFLLFLAVNRFYSENIASLRAVRESWYIRDSVLEAYAGTDEAAATCSLPCPGSSRDDILADPADPFNQGTASYYRVPAISADQRCPYYDEILNRQR